MRLVVLVIEVLQKTVGERLLDDLTASNSNFVER